jgi:membrane protein HdeD
MQLPREGGGEGAQQVAGALVVGAGIFCLFAPAIAGVAVAYLLGAAMLVAGGIELVAAFARPGGAWIRLGFAALGLVTIVFGALVIAHPQEAVASLTWLIGLALLISGGVRIVLAFGAEEARVTFFLAGAFSILLGVLLLIEWPLEGEWAFGVLLGLELIATGLTMLGWLRPVKLR